MGLFGKRINPATGRPHSDDKKLGANRKGRARRKKEHDERVARQKKDLARYKAQSLRRSTARLN